MKNKTRKRGREGRKKISDIHPTRGREGGREGGRAYLGLGVGHDLHVAGPGRVRTLSDRVVEVTNGVVRVSRSELVSLVGRQVADALVRLEVVLDVHGLMKEGEREGGRAGGREGEAGERSRLAFHKSTDIWVSILTGLSRHDGSKGGSKEGGREGEKYLALVIDTLEGMRAVAIHVPVPIGRAAVGEEEGDLVGGLGAEGDEVPEGIGVLAVGGRVAVEEGVRA